MDIKNKFFKSTEELVSMFLGLIIVLIAGALIFNYFQRQSGNVDLAGISTSPTPTNISLTTTPTATAVPTKKVIVIKPTNTSVPTVTATATATVAPVIIPTQTQREQIEPKQTSVYVVQKGDSLWKIAQVQYGSGYNWVDIAKANNLKNPGSLAVGQKLNIPGNVVKKEVITQTNKPKITIEGNTYTVVKGDSLSVIAAKAYGSGSSWTKIYEANKDKISRPNIIHSGLVLTIPR